MAAKYLRSGKPYGLLGLPIPPSKKKSLDSTCEEMPDLPCELWEKIWRYLDFNKVQKTCTLVSKSWLNGIRNSQLLSGEMKLTIGENDPSTDIVNGILLRWKKLQVIHLTKEIVSRFNYYVGFLIFLIQNLYASCKK